ncbi:hypothetical protein [Runella slithyformis]|uniref:Uncharacterized protein n=1 Tax=Runella slithyformis (strain ATCC 29530 / DSM 19594 / LMG 11500 / NCIMB 11436 / LSU 4) TaxID=761193 RepID=A0A7U3ZIQ6_RUNSL|nr:hypothetical protein [Runella slithyformis]AEI47959.1 hypothetical protein Runsl_1534 [Runella slithyformis DSM 19594]
MKHTFTAGLLLLSTTAFAQTEKGNSFISGNISTGYSSNIYPKGSPYSSGTFSLSSGISYGKFIKDDILWRIGAGETMHFTRFVNNAGPGNSKSHITNTTFSLSSSGIYFFGKERWRGFAGGGLSISGSFNPGKYMVDNQEVGKFTDTRFSVNPLFEVGAVHFFNKHLAVQFSATSTSFPLNVSGFSTGLLYWIKPASFDGETKALSVLDKGRWTLGVGFDVDTRRATQNLINQSSNSSETNENEANISLQVGKFVKSRTLVGFGIGYNKNSSQVISAQNSTTDRSVYRGEIYIKKYLFSTRLTPYWGVELNYMRSKQKQKDASANSTGHLNTFELRPNIGLAYLISNHFLVETQLADLLLNYNTQANSEYKNWGVNLSGGLRSNLRLSYVF